LFIFLPSFNVQVFAGIPRALYVLAITFSRIEFVGSCLSAVGSIIKFTELPLKNTLAKLTGHKNNRGLYRIN